MGHFAAHGVEELVRGGLRKVLLALGTAKRVMLWGGGLLKIFRVRARDLDHTGKIPMSRSGLLLVGHEGSAARFAAEARLTLKKLKRSTIYLERIESAEHPDAAAAINVISFFFTAAYVCGAGRKP